MRFGDVGDENLVAKRIFSSTKVLVATRCYLKEAPRLYDPDDLVHHRAVTSLSRDGHPEQDRPLHDGGRAKIRSTFAASDHKLRVEAVLLGLGLGLFARATIQSRSKWARWFRYSNRSLGQARPRTSCTRRAPRYRWPCAYRAAEFYGRWDP